MSTTTPVPTVPKVRTYASDLTATRNKRSLTTPNITPPTDVSLPIPKTNATPIAPHAAKIAPAVATKSSPASTLKAVPHVTALPLTQPTPKKIQESIIPPFHTLNKNVATPIHTIDTSEFSAATKNSKPSVLAQPGEEQLAVNTQNTEGDGTVITDTKRNRFSLFDSIQTSISSWFAHRKQTALRKKIPTYTVPEADRRKGVIQKATTQTGRTSTADHQAALSRIKSSQKTVRRNTAPTAVVTMAEPTYIQKNLHPDIEPFAEQVPETPTVTHELPAIATEPIVHTPPPEPFERPRITPTIPTVPEVITTSVPTVSKTIPTQSIAQKLHTLEQTNTLTETEVPPEPALPTQPVVTPIARLRITPTVPTLSASAPMTAVASEPEATTAEIPDHINEPTRDVIPHWAQAITTAPRSVVRGASIVRLFFSQTNHVALGVAGGISVVVIGWYGVQAILSMQTTAPATTSTVPGQGFLTTSSIFATTTLVTTKDAFVTVLKTANTDVDPLTEIAITHPISTVRLTPTELFEILDVRVQNNFVAAIDTVHFGSYRNTPWLVLATRDTAAVQGGMLAWENSIDSNLSPWFSSTTLRTAKKGITLFHDGTIAGHDVRILTDADGRERVVYGFITSNVVLIANNSSTFLNLADKSTE